MGKDQVMFKIGELVFAKVRGYPPWPAKITSVIDGRPNNYKYGVFFFGTSETAAVFHKDICLYKENRERLGKRGKRRFFREGIEQIEEEMREVEEREEPAIEFFPDGSPILEDNTNRNDSNDTDDSQLEDDNEETKFRQNRRGRSSEGFQDMERGKKGKLDENRDGGFKKIKPITEEVVKRKDKPEKVGRQDKSGKIMKKDKLEMIDRLHKTEKIGKTDKTENIGIQDKPEKTATVDPNLGLGEKRKWGDIQNENLPEMVGKELTPGKIMKGKGKQGHKKINKTKGAKVVKVNKGEKPEQGTKKRRSKAELIDVTPKLEQTSRSGRVIKPKKFLGDDEADEETRSRSKPQPSTSAAAFSSPAAAAAAAAIAAATRRERILKRSSTKGQDMGRIMWAKTKCGQMVQIKLDCDRPATFKDERARLMWERATDINAKRLKAEIEAGQITREDIKLQLRPTEEQKAKLSAKELFEMKRLRIIERKRGKLRWLKLETRLVDIDVLIKTCLQKSKADVEKALSLMDELINMPLDPLMLKKHPQVVDTTKKLRQYIGNAVEWNYSEDEAEAFDTLALKVRQKANSLFNKYTSLFAVPETSNFWSFFLEAVSEFSKLTQDMSRERVFGLIIDPSSPYFKDVCEDDKEEEEFKLKYNISADKYLAKRKARRVAGKR